jgi:hypothetical protein
MTFTIPSRMAKGWRWLPKKKGLPVVELTLNRDEGNYMLLIR